MKKEFWLDRWANNRVKILKNKKLRCLIFWLDSSFIFMLSFFASWNHYEINESENWYYYLFCFSWFLFYFLIGFVYQKIQKSKWKKDLYLSIAFYFIQPLALAGSIAIFILFKENDATTFWLIIACTIFTWNIFIFWRMYISNKPLFMAILKWQNVYPIIRKSLN